MFQHQVQIRVRYAETDQMGVVYYGNYATYYEVARVECIRALGLSYKQMEENGIVLPVLENYSKYIRPAKYDDLLTVTAFIKEMPSVRITFDYEIKNQAGTLLNIGNTTLVFLSKETGRPCPAPPLIVEALKPYFELKTVI
jgi:acyl-CoA thioester hydrolase